MEKITTSLRLYHSTQNHTTITQLHNSNPNPNYCTPFSTYISTNRPVLSLLHNFVPAILSHLYRLLSHLFLRKARNLSTPGFSISFLQSTTSGFKLAALLESCTFFPHHLINTAN